MFKLYYSISHEDDHSEVHFHLTKRAAERKSQEPFGSLELAINRGKILFRHTAPIWREVPANIVRNR